jgi:hypothetical protein
MNQSPLLSRRKLLVGAAALVAAPAIVRVSSLMPISVERPRLVKLYSHEIFNHRYEVYREGDNEKFFPPIIRKLYAHDVMTNEMILLEEVRFSNTESESVIVTLFSNLSRSHAPSS